MGRIRTQGSRIEASVWCAHAPRAMDGTVIVFSDRLYLVLFTFILLYSSLIAARGGLHPSIKAVLLRRPAERGRKEG